VGVAEAPLLLFSIKKPTMQTNQQEEEQEDYEL